MSEWKVAYEGGEWRAILKVLQEIEAIDLHVVEAGVNEDVKETVDVLVFALKTWFPPQALVDISRALLVRKIPVIVFGDYDLFPRSTFGEHPLLFTRFDRKLKENTQFLHTFFARPEDPGRIFAIEGGDGSGKETQTKLLVSKLKEEGCVVSLFGCAHNEFSYPVCSLDFPQDKAFAGSLIRDVLAGKKGAIKDVDPMFFSFLYSVNRYDVQPVLSFWIRHGFNIVLDRYMESNFGHQASKIEDDRGREELIEKLEHIEVDILDLPRSHRVFYLDLPPSFAERAMKDQNRTFDIHESAAASYKSRVSETFLWCAEKFSKWKRIPCTGEENGERLSIETVHESLFSLVEPELVNHGRVLDN